MQIGKLNFEKFESGASFLAQPVKDKILQMSEEEQSLCFVAQIDKEDMGVKTCAINMKLTQRLV